MPDFSPSAKDTPTSEPHSPGAGGPGALLPLALALAFGISLFRLLPLTGWFLGPALGAALVWGVWRHRRNAVVVVLVVILGFAMAMLRDPAPHAPPAPPANGTPYPAATVLTGSVLTLPSRDPSREQWSFELRDDANGSRYRIKTRAGSGAVPTPGDVIRIGGRFRPPRGFLNPGTRDWTRSMRERGIVGTLSADGFQVLRRGGGILRPVHIMRRRLADRIDHGFSDANAGFLKALLLGIREMDRATRDRFARAGVAHLLAVSGTHLGMLALVVIFLVRVFFLRVLPESWYLRVSGRVTAGWIGAAAAVPVVIGYAVVSGARVPTMRALIMILAVLVGVLSSRRHHWMNGLGLAAIILLLWDPQALWGASFQLTFAAVGSIGWFLAKTNGAGRDSGLPIRPARRERILVWLFLPVAALAGTAPIVAYHFGVVSAVSPVSNLLLTPLVGFVLVPAGFLNMIAGPVMDPVAEFLSGLVIALVRMFGEIPYGALAVPAPSPLWLCAYYVLLLVPKRQAVRCAGLGLLAAAPVLTGVLPDSGGNLRMVALDVGQGAAACITLPDSRTMLVDTGGLRFLDVGSATLVPALRALGVGRIHILVLTHLHPDHTGGLAAVFAAVPVDEVWWNGRATRDGDAPVTPPGTVVRALSRGDGFRGDGYRITVLHPPPYPVSSYSRGAYSDENNDSLVLRIGTPDGSILLPGDIEREAERDLILAGADLAAEVLLLSHHGSDTSSTAVFLERVRPRIAVISAGFLNRFGHPRGEVIHRLRERGIREYRTSRDGAIEVEFAPPGVQVKRWGDAAPRRSRLLTDHWWNLLRLAFNPSFPLTRGVRYGDAERTLGERGQ